MRSFLMATALLAVFAMTVSAADTTQPTDGAKGKITGIREYKDAYEDERAISEVNPALMCFDARWLWENIEKVHPNNAQGELYLTDLVALAFAQGQKIDTLEISPEEAIGINSPEEKEIAEAILAKKKGR